LLDNGHSVTLTEPYNFKLLQKLSLKKKIHPSLNINLPKKLKINKFSSDILNRKWDLIVIAVSSIGIDLIGKNLSKIKNKSPILVLTKGLKLDGRNLISMSSLLRTYNKNLNISVLKGPCLAKELARKVKSFTVVANKNINTAKKIGKLISTNYYQTEFSRDVNGVEFLSAIKNIYSMIIGSGQWHNTSSALFRKSIDEMKYLANYFKGKKETVYGLAGLGDLYVSAMGGRNSKMGEYLGKGYTFAQAKKKFMKNDTVEGADLAIEIAPFVFKKINKRKVPLMISLLEAIVKNKKLNIKY
jgi:glycerol-3-phosphate dehydrogenase (NAD(P)+)